MSHGGGAGKVYFVLYLAVVLELLIIIVERDEAEADLHKKQKETMKIVESILTQLQSGAGSEGINTRPQDEITIYGPNTIRQIGNVKPETSRKYIVEVGVTDVSFEMQKKEGEAPNEYLARFKKLIELANVDEIEYQLFYNSNQDGTKVPYFPTEEDLEKMKHSDLTDLNIGQTVPGTEGSPWEFISMRKLVMDKEATINRLNFDNLTMEGIIPIYPPLGDKGAKGPLYAPKDKLDSAFSYSHDESFKRSAQSGDTEIKKRSFVVYFEPPQKAGWYKLRFVSRTNRILGVRVDADPVTMDEETTVNIGTVQLTVRDLRKVQRELSAKLEEYGLPSQDVLDKEKNVDKFDEQIRTALKNVPNKDKADDIRSKIRLFGYIAKLLAPGQSIRFPQNKASIEFNVRVLTPPDVQDAKPTIAADLDQHRFDGLPPRIEFSVSPWRNMNENKIVGTVYEGDKVIGNLSFEPAGATASQSSNSGETQKIIGYLSTKLTPKSVPVTYKVRLTHSMGNAGKKDTTINLHIYPTQIKDANDKAAILKQRAYYGTSVNFTQYQPTSGLYIPENQFRVKFDLVGYAQGGHSDPGYSTPAQLGYTYFPDASAANYTVSWIDPLKLASEATSPEIVLFEVKGYKIKQKAPEISIANISYDIGGSEDRPKISFRGIVIPPPNTGYEDEAKKLADIDFQVGEVSVKVPGYKFLSKTKPVKNGNSYSFDVFLTGQMPDDATAVKGTVTVSFSATAKNANGSVSEKSPGTYTTPRFSKVYETE